MHFYRQQGVTLIELMIVVLIISVLAMFAFPAYQTSMEKARRSDGHAILLDLQSIMERHMYDNRTYPSKLSEVTTFSSDEVDSPEGHYKISLKAPTAACPAVNCYQLQAVAQGVQASDGNLELHSDGTKVGNW